MHAVLAMKPCPTPRLLCFLALVACSESHPSTRRDASGAAADTMTFECPATDLRAALASATAGSTVTAPPCRIEGSFTVPAGVTLAGADGDRSVIAGTEADAPVVELVPGIPPTGLRDLRIENAGTAGIRASGDGAVSVARVHVESRLGFGVALAGVTTAELDQLTIVGPVRPSTVGMFTWASDPSEAATHGLVAACVEELRMSDVVTRGFTRFGATLLSSHVRWRGGGAPGNLGVGVALEGGNAVLEDLSLSGTLQGYRLLPAYGAVFARGAEAQTARLRLEENEGVGMLVDASSAEHQDLLVRDNEGTGMWLQNASTMTMWGTATTLTGNGGGGVFAAGAAGLEIWDARIDATEPSSVVVGSGLTEVGDGIQISPPPPAMVLRDLSLHGNTRVGVVIDLGGTPLPDTVVIDGITVEGTGDQLGFVLQNGPVRPGWDRGVRRLGSTARNDAVFDSTLEGIVLDPAPTDEAPNGCGRF